MGGTGRSGTTITARLLGAHSAYHMINAETRFITARGGLCDVAARRATYQAFEGQVLGYWFERGPGKGLQMVMDRAPIETALPELRAGLASDGWAAARAFTHRLFDPLAAADGANGWIEMSPPNAKRAGEILRMFPDMKLIHSVRDGRDVACSVIPFKWGPADLDEGLEWWARKLERAFAGCEALPADRVLVLQMEDLIERDRDRQYGRLLAFLDLEDDAGMRAYFDSQITPERAHIGRWRTEVPADRLASFEAHYRKLVEVLGARRRPYFDDADARDADRESIAGIEAT